MESMGKPHEYQVLNQYILCLRQATPFLTVPAQRVQGLLAPRIQLSQLALRSLDTLLARDHLSNKHKSIYYNQGPGIPHFHSRTLQALQTAGVKPKVQYDDHRKPPRACTHTCNCHSSRPLSPLTVTEPSKQVLGLRTAASI